MSRTIRLTMAQALLRFLDAQYVELDGVEYKFVHGVYGIFGHGNLLGIGEALENMGELSLKYYQAHNEQCSCCYVCQAEEPLRNHGVPAPLAWGPEHDDRGRYCHVNRLPVLLLPGVPSLINGPDPVLQQLEMPYNYGLTVMTFKAVSTGIEYNGRSSS